MKFLGIDGSVTRRCLFQCPQSNEHFQYRTMYKTFVTTPIVFHSLLFIVTNMFNMLFRLDIYEWQDVNLTKYSDVTVLRLQPQPL